MALFSQNTLTQVSGFDNPIIAGEWHQLEALEDGTVFANIYAEGKY